MAPERDSIRPSKGIRKHIRQLKPEIRNLTTPEEEAWPAIEEIIKAQVEGWPERYRNVRGLIQDYHRTYYAITHSLPQPEVEKRENKIDQYSPQDLIAAKPVLNVIRRIYFDQKWKSSSGLLKKS